MNNREYHIPDLIPQRPPMIMIDCLTEVGELHAKGKLLIKPTNLFCLNGIFTEAGIIEFMAQTAAAHAGYKSLKNGREIKPGFIASIKNLAINKLPEIHNEITSEIHIQNELLGYLIISGMVHFGEEIIAECEMRVFIPES